MSDSTKKKENSAREKRLMSAEVKGELSESSEKFSKYSFYCKNRELKSAFLGKRALIIVRFRENLLIETNPNENLPSSFYKLLHDYADVFPKEGPPGLPPLRRIEH